MKKLLYIVLPMWMAVSCGSPAKEVQEPLSNQELAEAKAELGEVAGLSQEALLKNVAGAIEKGGTLYAVEFCNLNAVPLTDSLSNHYGVSISRITEKTRNPANALKTENDRSLYNSFLTDDKLKDSLVLENENLVYYKRINTSMPACIKCHGNPASDIEAETLKKIKTLYPGDMATGYGMNEFRGLWKIVKN